MHMKCPAFPNQAQMLVVSWVEKMEIGTLWTVNEQMAFEILIIK